MLLKASSLYLYYIKLTFFSLCINYIYGMMVLYLFIGGFNLAEEQSE